MPRVRQQTRETPERRGQREAVRLARAQGRSAGSYTGAPAADVPVHAGTMDSGEWVPYGRVGITPISDFRVRGE